MKEKKSVILSIILLVVILSIIAVNSENLTESSGVTDSTPQISEDNSEIAQDNVINVIIENITDEQTEIINETEETINNSGEVSEENTPDNNESINESTIFNHSSNESYHEDNNITSEINEEMPKNNDSVDSLKTEDLGNTDNYIDIDDIINENRSTDTEEKEPEKIKVSLFKDKEGRKVKELTGVIPEDIDINQIKKIERDISKSTKEVIIKSDEHIEDPLTAFTDIPEIPKDQKDSVTILWKNEDKVIKDIEFYDLDENGLYDRISWEVPHLSEQIFEIIVNFSTDNSSSSFDISVSEPSNGEVLTNPLTFGFNINYTNLSDVKCNLSIIGAEANHQYTIDPTDNSFQSERLPDGSYTWFLSCYNKNTFTYFPQTSPRTFTVNEGFSIEIEDPVYLLNDSEEIKINIDSNNNANVRIELISPDNTKTTLEENIVTPRNNYIIGRSKIDERGIYKVNITFLNLSEPYSIIKNFSVAEAKLSFDDSTINTGEEIEITTNINSPDYISYVLLEFGDGSSNTTYSNINQKSFSKNFYHEYNDEDEYIVEFTFKIDNKMFSIEKNGIDVESTGDDEDPTIQMLEPDEDEIVKIEPITFSYKASDNVKISNCTFRLYNATGSSGLWSYNDDDLVYEKINKNVENDKTVNIKLEDFDERDYFWEVECYDNSSNWESKEIFFSVDLSSTTVAKTSENNTIEEEDFDYDIKDNVLELKDKVDSFIESQESLDLEAKEALDDLNIDEDLNFYQRRLAQIDQDLGNNLKYISDEEDKEAKREELTNEFEDIKKKVPLNIRVVESKEFVKNSITSDLEAVVGDYLTAKDRTESKRTIKKIADINKQIQNYITLSTKVKHVELEYLDGIKKITLVSKDVTLKNQSFENILEVVPKEVTEDADDIIFFVDTQIIKKDPIIEINVDDLEEDRLIYYLEGYTDLNKLEDIDTILFKDAVVENIGITGFYVFESYDASLIYYILLLMLIIFLIYLGYYYYNKRRMVAWKKEENVIRILENMENAKKHLKINNITNAKENYHKIKELYPLIPAGCQKHIIKEVKKIRIGIDKREIFDLVKEYDLAKKQNREEDAHRIYNNVKSIYKRLPKRFQTIIYNKLFKPPALTL